MQTFVPNPLRRRPLRAEILASALITVLSTGCLDKDQIITSYQAKDAAGLKADYFNLPTNEIARTFSYLGQPTRTQVDQVYFDLPNGSAPAPGINANNFSVRWTGYLVPPQDGEYVICTCSDDGIRVFVDGSNILPAASFGQQTARVWGSGKLRLQKDHRHPIRIDYFQLSGAKTMKLYWARDRGPLGWEDVCYFKKPDGTKSEVCESPSLPPEGLEPLTWRNLVPAGDETQKELAECQSPREYLTVDRLPASDNPSVGKALSLFERLTGTRAPIYDARIKTMAALIDQGQAKEAARIATKDNGFYEKTVRGFAARMSTREERPDVKLNDFIATVIGVTRDRIDARKLLTANFLYRAKSVFFWGETGLYDRASLVASNRHYEELENSGLPLACALDKLDRYTQASLPMGFEQMVASAGPSMKINPEPAGLLTSRAFGEAHIIAGTNRRPIQKAFEYFLCTPIDALRSQEVSEEYIGRDVERFPNGPDSVQDFHQVCKTCHGTLDSLRPAFAEFNFENGVLKYAPFFAPTPLNVSGDNAAMETENNMKLWRDNQGRAIPIARKMNHNAILNGEGNVVLSNEFENLFAGTVTGSQLGWSYTSGKGPREFGRMIATAQAFPRCMAKRVYQQVCKNDPFNNITPELKNWLDSVGDQFATNGYDLKDLFETMGTLCMDK